MVVVLALSRHRRSKPNSNAHAHANVQVGAHTSARCSRAHPDDPSNFGPTPRAYAGTRYAIHLQHCTQLPRVSLSCPFMIRFSSFVPLSTALLPMLVGTVQSTVPQDIPGHFVEIWGFRMT